MPYVIGAISVILLFSAIILFCVWAKRGFNKFVHDVETAYYEHYFVDEEGVLNYLKRNKVDTWS